MMKHTIGVVVENRKTNHFAMGRMREVVLHQRPLRLKNQERLIYVNVNIQKRHRIAMDLMQSCNEWENRYQQG